MCLRNGPAFFARIRVRMEEGLRRLRSNPRGREQGPNRGCAGGSTPPGGRSCGLRLGPGGCGDDVHLRGRAGDEQARDGSHSPGEEGRDPAVVASGRVSRRDFDPHPGPEIRADAGGNEHQRQEKEAAQLPSHGTAPFLSWDRLETLAIAPPFVVPRYDRTSSMYSLSPTRSSPTLADVSRRAIAWTEVGRRSYFRGPSADEAARTPVVA